MKLCILIVGKNIIYVHGYLSCGAMVANVTPLRAPNSTNKQHWHSNPAIHPCPDFENTNWKCPTTFGNCILETSFLECNLQGHNAKKKMQYFPSTDSRCLSHLARFFRLGFCVSFKGAILATQCHGYIVPTLFNVVLRLQWCHTALSTLPSYVHCMLRCGPLRSRAGTPHSTFFALPFAMCIIFPHLSIQGCWILCDGPPSSSWSPAGPQLQALDRSVPRRTTTADSGSKCSLPDLHRKLRIRMFPAGPLNSTLEKIKMKH